MKNTIIAAVLFPLTFILMSACIKNENIINLISHNKEFMKNFTQNKSPCQMNNFIDATGSIIEAINDCPPTSPQLKIDNSFHLEN